MRIRSLLSALLLVCGLAGRPAVAAATPLAVAAAADLRGTLEELKAGFEAGHPGVQLLLTFGASGSLTAQIQQGAPFDVFLSADTGFPEQLQKAGLAGAQDVFPYATGSLVLWVRRELGLDPAREGLKLLTNPAIRKIAVANAQTAPYGRAAEAALKSADLHEALKPKLVFADNIAQAAQFLQTGAAEAGLVSAAQADQPALRQGGLAWVVPKDAYPPLRQAGVVLPRSPVPELARAFRAYLTGAEGQAILARHGFGRP
jgi:molybdate transport system substrate-binding protein